jgi:NAD+ synthase (glutamine-hydrolysing)
MPYPVLAAIERSAIGELHPLEKTVEVLCEQFPQYDEATLQAWTQKFHHLWRVSQWKRERLAPSFHLDTLSVDPKAWRRWPILSGKWAAGGGDQP